MKNKLISFILFSFILGLLSLTTSCGKNNSFSKKHLSFSLDTLVFDTVFTTIGSTTQQFKIYNNENKTLNIEEIELMGGANSFFRMNVDGISQNIIKDTKILGNDSLFAFVEVTLNKSPANKDDKKDDDKVFATMIMVIGKDATFKPPVDNSKNKKK